MEQKLYITGMEAVQKTREKFTPLQLDYIMFLAAAQIDENGKRWTKAEWCNLKGVSDSLVYQWQQLPGFWDKVCDVADQLVLHKYANIMKAMYLRSLKGDVNATKLIMNQANKLKSERKEVDVTSGGQPLVMPSEAIVKAEVKDEAS